MRVKYYLARKTAPLEYGTQHLARKLPPDHSAIIGLFENVWERKLKEVAGKYAGAVTDQRLITPAALAKAASELVAGRAAPV